MASQNVIDFLTAPPKYYKNNSINDTKKFWKLEAMLDGKIDLKRCLARVFDVNEKDLTYEDIKKIYNRN